MKVEKLERVCLGVRNLEKTIDLFSKLFGITFEIAPSTFKVYPTMHANPNEARITRVAMSPIGLELIETDPPPEKEGMRSFHLKVSDLEGAKAEMEEKGIRKLSDITYGDMKEAVFCQDDLHGARIVLVEFEASTSLDAAKQRR